MDSYKITFCDRTTRLVEASSATAALSQLFDAKTIRKGCEALDGDTKAVVFGPDARWLATAERDEPELDLLAPGALR